MIGYLFGNRVLVDDKELPLIEAYYLLDKGELEVYEDDKKLSKEEFLKKCLTYDERFLIRYKAYKELRDKGYTLGTALKFGADFRVYDIGVIPKKGKRSEREHSKWVLYPVSKDETFDFYEFASKNRVAHSTRKKLLLGIVSDKIEFIEVSWKKP
ncbi:NEQ205 [Nanoarchaeum equitans Kin4-M]|uniref:tRNA-splicing endonuclease n=1 Tax=Nanoarchaeum equitans (strain Kin4-M) TaxID=228908 RepID=ENDA_NANEQ|nr:RecName: Full=tRNA-splicing endonuclease; AltName: Full=tRNA-intron endonuclease [Nanoarchaeum equitans Kin4-M]AAR39058.1 NEQ205 [Nanoarchaeum equitans Kin4-M]